MIKVIKIIFEILYTTSDTEFKLFNLMSFSKTYIQSMNIMEIYVHSIL